MRVGLFVMAGLCLVAVISDGLELELLDRIADGARPSDAELTFNDARQGAIAAAQLFLYIALAIAFIMWFFRAYSNLPRLGVPNLRFGPGWAIGAWFVPFLNLVRPKAIANDIWKGSDPDLPPRTGRTWVEGSIPGALLGWWWFFWLVSGVADRFAFRAGGDSPADLKNASLTFLISDLLTVPAALLAATVVKKLNDRQEERAARLEQWTQPVQQ